VKEEVVEGGKGKDGKKAGSGPLNPRVLLGIAVILAAGLVFFYMFSAPYGDGLENTMEEGEVEESESVHDAPLDYGDDYGSTLVMGLVGLTIMILLVYGLARAMPDRSRKR
jgi:cobalt/nickel transport protein